MIPIAWPTTLPKCPQTWTETPIDVIIRSEIDVGAKKVRRRFTRSRLTISVTLTMEKSYYKPFNDFYKKDLKNGLLSFTYKHPYSGILTECRFIAVPTYSMQAKAFTVNMQWETM